MSDSKSLDCLFQLLHSFKRNLHHQIEALELDIVPMQVRVLKIIANKPQCTAVDIATFLDRDKAQVTRLLNSLIEQALILKKANPEDRRSQYLLVTQSGEEILAKLAKVEASIFEKMKAGLNEQDLTTFEHVARTMSSNLNK
jgi:DNA-binding MarR family transcriptional regulator